MKSTNLIELNHLFDIVHGNKLDLNKMTQVAADEDAVAFVGRSGTRNGVVANVKPIVDIEAHKAGYITVALGGAALSSFVQPRPFYTAQNIDVLKPKKEMSLDEKLYYCLCIEANSFRYSTFGREANRTLHRLLVPSLESVPNWVKKASAKALAELNDDLMLFSGK
jgi:hypothetical protein